MAGEGVPRNDRPHCSGACKWRLTIRPTSVPSSLPTLGLILPLKDLQGRSYELEKVLIGYACVTILDQGSVAEYRRKR
jgi:hypothetical protein